MIAGNDFLLARRDPVRRAAGGSPRGERLGHGMGHASHLMGQPVLDRWGSGAGSWASTCRIAAVNRSPVIGTLLPGVEASKRTAIDQPPVRVVRKKSGARSPKRPADILGGVHQVWE